MVDEQRDEPRDAEHIHGGEAHPFPRAGFFLDATQRGDARRVELGEDHEGDGGKEGKGCCHDALHQRRGGFHRVLRLGGNLADAAEDAHGGNYRLFRENARDDGSARFPIL